MATTLAQLAPFLKEYWFAPPSQETLDEIDPYAAMIQKGPPSGEFASMEWTGTGDGLMALVTQGSGNIGSNRTSAYNNSKSRGGVRGTAYAARQKAYFRMDSDELHITLQKYDGPSGAATIMERLEDTPKNFWRSRGPYLFQDGRGGVAALSATSGVGTTITLVNKNQVRAFEIGDVLVGYDPAVYDAAATVTAIGVPATPRTGTVTVTDRNEDAGTLTISANWSTLGGGAGAAGDIVGHQAWIPESSGSNLDRAGLYGIRTWVAFTAAEQAVTALGIDRSSDPGRTAGRLNTDLTKGAPTVEVLRKIKTLCGRYQIRPDIIMCPVEDTTDLDREYEDQRKTDADVVRGVWGMTGWALRRQDGGQATVVGCPGLWDYRSNDRIFIATESRRWGLITDSRGIGWSTAGRPMGNSGLIDTDGKGDLSAEYGCLGQHVTNNPAKTIVVRVPRS
jgi:hypothetical protein